MKRTISKLDAEVMAYTELSRAIQKFYRRDDVFHADVQRVLGAVCARWFHYQVNITVEKP